MVQTISTNQAIPVKGPIPTDVPRVVVATLKRAEQLKAKKQPWLDQYQLLGEFVHMRKQEFQQENTAGEFLTRDIFDPSAPKAAKTAASTLMSLLWPNTKNRFKFYPSDLLDGTTEEKEYFKEATKRQLRVMDDPKAGFAIATGEYLLDQVVFGTSGTETVKDDLTKVRYTPWGVGHMSIAEGRHGQVDTVYLEIKLDNQTLVKNYGLENVSEKTRDEFNEGKFDIEKIVIIAIEPRITKVQGGMGNKNMPFSSVHIEKESKHLLKESGFEEMPITVTRITKLLGEVYGRSLAMDALPDILQSNALWESVMIAVEKSLDPPLGVYSDGTLGGGEIDTSAGAISVFNPSDQAKDRAPIFPLFTVGEFRQMKELLAVLSERISNHFLIDRLLDFNNETRMTATEATLRDRMRSATLGQMFNIQINSYFIPQVERTFNILLDSGDLGVPAGSLEAEEPGAFVIPATIVELMVAGEDIYRLEFFTPATRIMQSEEAEGILRTAELAKVYVELGKLDVLDRIDADTNIQLYGAIVGAPEEGFHTDEEVQDAKEAQDAEQEANSLLDSGATIAEGMRNAGQSGLMPTTKPQ